MQVESRNRAAGALPVALAPLLRRPGDQHDRPPVALDETRGDDPDHALVPVLVGEDVAATCSPGFGPSLDLLDGLAGGCRPRPADGRGSAPRGRAASRTASSSSSVSRSSSAASGRQSRPAALMRGARRKATAPSSIGCRVDAGRAHQGTQARAAAPGPGAGGRRARTPGSRPRAGRRRRSSPARPGRGADRGRRRRAPARACRRHRSRRAPGTGSRTAVWRRSGSRAASRPAGGGR